MQALSEALATEKGSCPMYTVRLLRQLAASRKAALPGVRQGSREEPAWWSEICTPGEVRRRDDAHYG